MVVARKLNSKAITAIKIGYDILEDVPNLYIYDTLVHANSLYAPLIARRPMLRYSPTLISRD